MSFENIKNIDLNNTHQRACIMIINFNGKELAMIKNISNMIGLRDQIILNHNQGKNIIKDILDNKEIIQGEDGIKNKAVIFNNVASTKINAFLDSLKKMRVNRPLTAIVTEDSKDWPIGELIKNLATERASLSQGKFYNHK
ncbi:MAG: DUF3783 domain-containing protein [Romboutsia sp.]